MTRPPPSFLFFFFNDTATTEIYTLSLHDALPILLKKYQLKASECIFIDDRLENVQAAFALGFAGIQMKDSVGTLIRSLATCNVALR